MAFVTVEDTTGSIEMLVFPKTLSRYSQMLTPGAVVVLSGRISVREEEDPKLLCEKVMTIEEKLAMRGAKKEPQPAAPAAAANPARRTGLYLKLPSKDSEEMQKARNLLEIFEGETCVYVVFSDTGKAAMAPRSMWCDPNEVLLRLLGEAIGAENVKLVQ